MPEQWLMSWTVSISGQSWGQDPVLPLCTVTHLTPAQLGRELLIPIPDRLLWPGT